LLLLRRIGPEHNAKFDLRVLRQQLQLRVLDESLEHLRERLENLTVEGHASPALAERATCNFLVAVLEDVELHFDVKRVEERSVSKVDPLNDVVEVLHGLPIELVEVKLVK